MQKIETIAALEALYGEVSEASSRKVTTALTPLYTTWIEASRFCILSSVSEEGTDASPRGDNGPVVQVFNAKTLLMPDWRGNNRLDTLRNIVRDGRVSVMFLVPGENVVMRVNGTAFLSVDEGLRQRFEQKGKHPASVIVIDIGEVYPQCPKSLLRSGVWSRDDSDQVPSLGELLEDATKGEIDGAAFDEAFPERAQRTLW
ncbi:pyridoxamine 5'-phosphate oxidase family protein [Rhodobacteraceae bacterium D3-12]|nr:pyridoxamine 5'-phosphate oxidase family protein [Rhodobacteraceae bacterium D3-12]